MQTAQQLKSILEKYLAGTCSPEEKTIIESWFEKGGNLSKPDIQLDEINRAALLRRIHAVQDRKSPPSPGHKNVIHTLLNGWRAAAIWAAIITTAGMAAWKSGMLKFPTDSTTPQIAYRSIQTGKGEIRQVQLPDGSTITLNAHSKLEYHPDFTTHRQIRLQGEALFTVTHDKSHPFTVTTNDSLATTVLGTQFNIRSYNKSQETRITVVSGIVAVNKGKQLLDTLTRSEAIRYQQSSRDFTINHNVNTESITGWTKGEWDYENLRFNDLALLLQNHYGIHLSSQRNTEMLQTAVSVNFNSRQTAKEILEVFCSFANCSFRQLSFTAFELY